jgi:hypothetical protein
MNIQIKPVPQHSYCLAAVTSEMFLNNSLSDITTLTDTDGIIYNVIERIIIDKTTIIPTVLMLLAFGKVYEDNIIWENYKNSDRIIFFICQKQGNNMK